MVQFHDAPRAIKKGRGWGFPWLYIPCRNCGYNFYKKTKIDVTKGKESWLLFSLFHSLQKLATSLGFAEQIPPASVVTIQIILLYDMTKIKEHFFCDSQQLRLWYTFRLRCLASKRCSAPALNCRYLNTYIKLKLIELSIELYQAFRGHGKFDSSFYFKILDQYSLIDSSISFNLILGFRYLQFKVDALHRLDARHL